MGLPGAGNGMTDSEFILLFHDWCDLYLMSAFDPDPKTIDEFRRWQEAARYSYDPTKMRPEEKRMVREYRRQEALGVE